MTPRGMEKRAPGEANRNARAEPRTEKKEDQAGGSLVEEGCQERSAEGGATFGAREWDRSWVCLEALSLSLRHAHWRDTGNVLSADHTITTDCSQTVKTRSDSVPPLTWQTTLSTVPPSCQWRPGAASTLL